jgi:hypothetical protein
MAASLMDVSGRARTLPETRKCIERIGVPYENRTRVAAVKEKRPGVIKRNLAAGIALYRI